MGENYPGNPPSALFRRLDWTARALRRGADNVKDAVLCHLVSPMMTQVGGHRPLDKRTGMLSLWINLKRSATAYTLPQGEVNFASMDGVILKPLQSGERGIREVSFYEAMANRDSFGHSFAGLKPFLCGYHGIITLTTASKVEQHYIMLDDCTAHMKCPCVLDMKLGTRTTEPKAATEKQMKSLTKYPCQSEFGCRLVGMRVWCGPQKQYLEYDKAWGFSLRDDAAMHRGLIDFFGGHTELSKCRLLIADFARRLAALLDFFESQEQLTFISSSLLFVYDSHFFHDHVNKSIGWSLRSELKIIDFAHVRNNIIRDLGYIEGLRRVHRFLGELLRRE